MRSTANNEQSSNNKDGKGGRVRQHIETPSVIRSQRPVEPIHLDQSERAESEFEIRGTTPDCCHDSKDDPAFHIARIFQTVVESNWDGGRVNENEESKDEEPPALPTVVPSEGKLRQ
jgi:hypothetical protein